MTFFLNSTDASNLYRPSSAAGTLENKGTVVGGSLSDVMKNGLVFRITQVVPAQVQYNELKPTAVMTDTFGTL